MSVLRTARLAAAGSFLIAALLAGCSSGSSGGSAAKTNSTTTSTPACAQPGQGGGSGNGQGKGGSQCPASLVVQQVAGDRITGLTKKGGAKYVTVSPQTTYTKNGVPATLSDVTAGETISVRGSQDQSGDIEATSIDIKSA